MVFNFDVLLMLALHCKNINTTCMSELANCATTCPIQEWCNEGEMRRDLISTSVIIDAAAEAVTALGKRGAGVVQYDEALFEDLSDAQRELMAQDVDRTSPQFFNLVSQVMERHSIPAREWGSVMIGKLAWTAAKAVQEAEEEITQIDTKLSEFDMSAVRLGCPGKSEVIVRDESKLRMCASNAISLARRQEITKPLD